MNDLQARFEQAFWIGGCPTPAEFLDAERVTGGERSRFLAVLVERRRRLRARERQVVAEFVGKWASGETPRIEDFLEPLAEPERSGLLRPLLKVELRHRNRSIEEILRRLPGRESDVKAALLDVLTERLGRQFWSGEAKEHSDIDVLTAAVPESFREMIVKTLRSELFTLATRRFEARGWFERKIRQGDRPRLEDAIAGLPEPERSGLLVALARIEVFYDAALGPEVYRSRFSSPTDRALLHAAVLDVRRSHAWRFSAVAPVFRTQLSVISEAVDHELGRIVALKWNAPDLDGGASAPARLRREALITGRLEHPHVLPVYGLGSDADGRFSFAMRFYDGQSFAQVIAMIHSRLAAGRDTLDFSRVDRPERALLVRLSRVCRTIAFAHQGILGSDGCSRLRVIHGDIKSRNILVSKDFATPQDFGEVYCIDWGLARLVGQKGPLGAIDPTGLDPTGGAFGDAVGGTPQYMSPEQAARWFAASTGSRGDLPEVLEPSDLYNLGATLYEVLVGRPPMDDLASEPPGIQPEAFARRLNDPGFDGLILPPGRRVPAPLAAICRQATRRNPADRYASAGALADDLDRWLADQPVSAYRDPWGVRLARFIRRHQVAASSAAVAAVGLLALAVAALVLGGVARRERAITAAIDAARLGDTLCEDAALGPGLETLARARDLAIEAGHTRLADDLTDSRRGWETAWGKGIPLADGTREGGRLVAFSTDGQWVVRTTAGRGVEVWQITNSLVVPPLIARPVVQPQGALNAEVGIVALAVSPKGAIFAGSLGRGVIWTPQPDGSAYSIQVVDEGDERLLCAAFGGDQLVLGTGSGEVLTFRRRPRSTFLRGERPLGPTEHEPVTAIAASQDGLWIAAGFRSGLVRVWHNDREDQWSTLPTIAPAEGHRDSVSSVDLADPEPYRVRLAIASRDGGIRWGWVGPGSTGWPDKRSRAQSGVSVVSVRSGVLLTGGRDGSVRGCSENALEEMTPTWHPRPIRALRQNPTGKWVLVADDAGGLWVDRTKPETGKRLQPTRGSLGRATAVAFWRVPGSDRCVVGGDSGRVAFFDPETGRERPLAGPDELEATRQGAISGLAIDADGQHLWVATDDGRVWSWTGTSRTEVPVWPASGRPQRILAIAAGAGPGEVALLGERGTIVLIRAHESRRFEVAGASTLASAPDGTLFVGLDDGRGVLYLDGTIPRLTARLHGRRIVAAAISADSKWLLTGSEDLTARLWELPTLSEAGFPLMHGDSVTAVAFRPARADDLRVIVATGSEDRTARLWDAGTGRVLGPRRRHGADVLSVAFDPGGSWLATGSGDGSARLLPLPEFTQGGPTTTTTPHSPGE